MLVPAPKAALGVALEVLEATVEAVAVLAVVPVVEAVAVVAVVEALVAVSTLPDCTAIQYCWSYIPDVHNKRRAGTVPGFLVVTFSYQNYWSRLTGVLWIDIRLVCKCTDILYR